HSNPPVPRFYTVASQAHSLRLSESGLAHTVSTKTTPIPKTHALSLIKCGWNITLSNSVDTAIRIDFYSAQRCTVLPTRYEPPDQIRELKGVTRCTPSPALLSPATVTTGGTHQLSQAHKCA